MVRIPVNLSSNVIFTGFGEIRVPSIVMVYISPCVGNNSKARQKFHIRKFVLGEFKRVLGIEPTIPYEYEPSLRVTSIFLK
jgi:hypothetical protein